MGKTPLKAHSKIKATVKNVQIEPSEQTPPEHTPPSKKIALIFCGAMIFSGTALMVGAYSARHLKLKELVGKYSIERLENIPSPDYSKDTIDLVRNSLQLYEMFSYSFSILLILIGLFFLLLTFFPAISIGKTTIRKGELSFGTSGVTGIVLLLVTVSLAPVLGLNYFYKTDEIKILKEITKKKYAVANLESQIEDQTKSSARWRRDFKNFYNNHSIYAPLNFVFKCEEKENGNGNGNGKKPSTVIIAMGNILTVRKATYSGSAPLDRNQKRILSSELSELLETTIKTYYGSYNTTVGNSMSPKSMSSANNFSNLGIHALQTIIYEDDESEILSIRRTAGSNSIRNHASNKAMEISISISKLVSVCDKIISNSHNIGRKLLNSATENPPTKDSTSNNLINNSDSSVEPAFR